MHLFFENVSINMFKHWSGAFFKSGNNNEDYLISDAIWKIIGKTMEESRRNVPLEFGPHHVTFISILMDSKPKNGLIG
jgi:hypothetical protein